MSVINQISVFIPNAPGSLAKMAEILGDCGINLVAFNLAESSEFGVLRIIVRNPQETLAALAAKNVTAKITEVVGIRMKDVPGALAPAASVLGAAGINIRYAYAFTLAGGEAVLFIRVDEPAKAVAAFEAAGFALEKESDL